MKVLHLEFGRNLYGGALQVAYLLRGLEEFSEIESHLVCPTENELSRRAASLRHAQVHPLRLRGEADLLAAFQLARLIRKIRPGIIHIHSRRGADFWGVLLARWFGVPCILTRRVDNPETGWLIRWRSRQAAVVTGISERICEVLRESGVPSGKVRLIRSRVDSDLYRPARVRAILEKVAQVPPEARTVAMIAQLIERKGHQILLKAAPQILQQHPGTVFLIFGKGPLRKKLEQQVAGESWASQIRFLGFRDDLAQVLPNVDIVAHPASMEGLGVALLQAAACGVPVVATRAGGIPEIVRDGENGFLVDPEDEEALASKIGLLLGDEQLRSKMGQRGREIIEEEFSISGMVRAYRDLYKEIFHSS